MKKLLLSMLALCTLWSTANATLIFHESFDYSTGDLYSSDATNDWWQNTGTTTDPIQVIAGSLTYKDYQATAVGNSIKLKETASAQKVYKKFDNNQMVSSGSIYYAALINIASATGVTDANTGYFLAMCAQTRSGLSDKGSGTDVARLSAYAASDGKYKLAVSRGNTTLASTTTEYEFGQTYLVVVKYTIVEGINNDVVSLYVNPTTTEPTVADAVFDDTSGSDVSTTNGGFAALIVRQGATATKKAPILTIDEIKVATAWSDLFESGDTPEPETKATITTSKTTLSFGSLYVGDTEALTFTVSGKNLSGDITLASDNAELVLDQTTITKAAAEADGGVEVTATLTAATAGTPTATITLSSDGADAVTISASWNAIAATQVGTIAALKAAAGKTAEVVFLYTGEAVITYSETSGSYGTPTFYVEDETGAVCVYDYFDNVCKVGDKIKDFKVVASEEDSRGILPLAFASKVTIVSSGNTPTPQVVTLKELQDNAADYLLELVKVENVTLDNTEANYKAGNNAISQNGTSGAISLTADNTLVGTAKPTTADITGISYYTSGYNIRVRSAADIVVKAAPTTIETISLDQLTGEYEIYTVSGVRVAELQAGVNIVRMGNRTYKVIR